MYNNMLFLDIETSPLTVFVWSLFKNNRIDTKNIIDTGKTLCYSASWGDGVTMYDSIKDKPIEEMLKPIWKLFDAADIIVHYNGKSFDVPVLQKEFVKYGFLPPSPFKQIDLFHVVKKNFRFPSYKLDFVCRELGIGAKVSHKGIALWDKCMKNDPDSWAEMEEYNKQDVQLLISLYNRLLPWIDNHPNMSLYGEHNKMTCSRCGSDNLQHRGYSYTLVNKFKRFVCKDCGGWGRSRVSDVAKENAKNILTKIN